MASHAPLHPWNFMHMAKQMQQPGSTPAQMIRQGSTQPSGDPLQLVCGRRMPKHAGLFRESRPAHRSFPFGGRFLENMTSQATAV